MATYKELESLDATTDAQLVDVLHSEWKTVIASVRYTTRTALNTLLSGRGSDIFVETNPAKQVEEIKKVTQTLKNPAHHSSLRDIAKELRENFVNALTPLPNAGGNKFNISEDIDKMRQNLHAAEAHAPTSPPPSPPPGGHPPHPAASGGEHGHGHGGFWQGVRNHPWWTALGVGTAATAAGFGHAAMGLTNVPFIGKVLKFTWALMDAMGKSSMYVMNALEVPAVAAPLVGSAMIGAGLLWFIGRSKLYYKKESKDLKGLQYITKPIKEGATYIRDAIMATPEFLAWLLGSGARETVNEATGTVQERKLGTTTGAAAGFVLSSGPAAVPMVAGAVGGNILTKIFKKKNVNVVPQTKETH